MSTFQKGENWFIDYRVHGRRKREKIGPSKKLAEEVLCKRLIQIAENRYLDIKKEERIRFSDFADLYLRIHSQQNKKSWKSTDNGLVKSLKAFFKDTVLQDVTPMLIEQYKAHRRNEVCPTTVKKTVSSMIANTIRQTDILVRYGGMSLSSSFPKPIWRGPSRRPRGCATRCKKGASSSGTRRA